MTKEQEILSIAEDEFYHNGYLATSMVTVARRAGVTHAMINYYYRSKEQLFLKILDSHMNSFIEILRPVMKEGGDFIQVLVDAAGSVFDSFNADRMFPSLILNVIRTAPEMLERYREQAQSFVSETMDRHSVRLRKEIEAGRMADTTMMEIFENILLLTASPFLMLPTLENLYRLDSAGVDAYLSRRRQEIEAVIRSRYSASRPCYCTQVPQEGA